MLKEIPLTQDGIEPPVKKLMQSSVKELQLKSFPVGQFRWKRNQYTQSYQGDDTRPELKNMPRQGIQGLALSAVYTSLISRR